MRRGIRGGGDVAADAGAGDAIAGEHDCLRSKATTDAGSTPAAAVEESKPVAVSPSSSPMVLTGPTSTSITNAGGAQRLRLPPQQMPQSEAQQIFDQVVLGLRGN